MKNLSITHFILIISIYSIICFNYGHSSTTDSFKPNCVNIKNLLTNEGLYIKTNSNSGSAKVCRKEKTCCSGPVEFKLNVKSKTEFQQKFRQLINETIETILVNWAEQFDDYFIKSIQSGHKEFDFMFQRLYGPRYKENYEIFSDLFKNIQLFHQKGDIKLERSIDEFFENLFIRLFKMLNPNFHFNKKYENCISESFGRIEPFGDVPKNLLNDLKRQLGASRTFVQGLFAGATLIKHLNQVDISNSCGTDLMQINYCSICQGHLNLRPCKAKCESAYTKCLINYRDFENEWNNYLINIIQFGKRLESTLNIENMLGSMSYKISDVIMYFQENKISISDKIFEKCNSRKIRKRSTLDNEKNEKETNNKFEGILLKNQAADKNWKKLATEVKKKIKNLKSYWSKLPKAICKNLNPAEKCWNGTHSIDHDKNVKASSIDIKINKSTNIYRMIDLQRNALQVINKKLISSYNGNGLEKFDTDTQASNIGTIPTEFNENNNDDYTLDYGEEETDYERKQEDDNEPQILDEQINKLAEVSNKKRNELRSEISKGSGSSGSENLKKRENENLENNINNFYPNIDKPKDASLNSNSNSYLIEISIYNFIILNFLIYFIFNNF